MVYMCVYVIGIQHAFYVHNKETQRNFYNTLGSYFFSGNGNKKKKEHRKKIIREIAVLSFNYSRRRSSRRSKNHQINTGIIQRFNHLSKELMYVFFLKKRN